jgi:mycothiol synthase
MAAAAASETNSMTTLIPRPFCPPADLSALHHVLLAGRRAMAVRPGSYYVHIGDVNWWLFYLNQDDDPFGHLTLWEDAGEVVAWSLLSPRFGGFDVFTHPALSGTLAAEQVWAWTEARLAAVLAERGQSGGALRTMWVGEHDSALIAWLQARGFAPDLAYYLWHMERPLAAALPTPCLPEGFTLRPVAGAAEAAPRALAAHAAFGSRQPEAAYVEKYRRFMQSPVYAEAVDLVVVPPSAGAAPPSMAAFAVAWADHANGVGLFEPVGTHPHFQRLGLGKALLLAGLRHMQAAGLHTATVCVECDNPAALRLYASAGFEPVRKILTYTRLLTKDA